MPAEKPRLLTQTDGTVVVFYRGWRFAFPDSAARPTVTKQDAPPGAGAAGSKVKTAGLHMRYGRWVAIFDASGETEPQVIRARPRLPNVVHRVLRSIRRG